MWSDFEIVKVKNSYGFHFLGMNYCYRPEQNVVFKSPSGANEIEGGYEFNGLTYRVSSPIACVIRIEFYGNAKGFVVLVRDDIDNFKLCFGCNVRGRTINETFTFYADEVALPVVSNNGKTYYKKIGLIKTGIRIPKLI